MTIKIQTNYYQQFDADVTRDVSGEAYGGWKKAELELSKEHTAVVLMHSWSSGTPEEYPGWWRAVEYLPRAAEICKSVIPGLRKAVRDSGMNLIHVVGGDYYKDLPGYKRAVELAGPTPEVSWGIERDEVYDKLNQFKSENVFVGKHNKADCDRGTGEMTFGENSHPEDDEYVVENCHQMSAVCKHLNINHLIYTGFAINWCLLLSPGGMAEMRHYGVMCSTIRQATTAVENKMTAREELCKEIALWRVAVGLGFVYDLDDFIEAVG